MKMPMMALRMVTVGTALLVSFVLMLMLLALLPPPVGLLLFVAGLGLVAALAVGQLESVGVPVLTWSREPTAAERQVFAPVLASLGELGVDVGTVYVRRAQRPTAPAAARVGRSMVVAPWLIEGIYWGQVSVDEAAAVIAHAAGVHRAARGRCELAVLAATTPWRAVVAVVRGAGSVFALVPFVGAAWTLRGVVGVVCVIQSVAEGHSAIGLLAGSVIALTYLMPAGGKVLRQRAQVAADDFVVELGLGTVLGGLLRRHGHPVTIERLQRLEVAPQPPQRPTLRLVRS